MCTVLEIHVDIVLNWKKHVRPADPRTAGTDASVTVPRAAGLIMCSAPDGAAEVKNAARYGT